MDTKESICANCGKLVPDDAYLSPCCDSLVRERNDWDGLPAHVLAQKLRELELKVSDLEWRFDEFLARI